MKAKNLNIISQTFRFTRRLAAVALLAALPLASSAATYTKQNTTTMNSASDWSAGWTSPTGTSTDVDTWSASTISLANAMTMTLGGTISCATLNFNPSSGSPAATAEVINADGNSLNLYTSIVNAAAVSTVVNCPIILNGNATFTTKGDMTIGGAISETGGSRAVTFSGVDAWMNLSAANTYSGLTTVNAECMLTLKGSGTIGNGTGGLTMATVGINGSWLDLGGTTQSVGAVNFGSGAVIQNGTLNATAFSNYGVVSANLGGAGALTMNSTNNFLILSGTLSYTGGTTNTGGTILTTKPLPLSGNILMGGAGALVARVGGAGEWAASDISSLLSYGNLTVNSGGTLGFDTTDGNFTNAAAISGPTPANLAILKQGPNTLTLSGANTYQKATTIRAGTLMVDNTAGGSLSSSSPLTFTGTGTFNYNTASTAQSLGALTLSAGDGTAQLTRTANTTLTFASLATRAAGATANFSLSGGTPSLANGFILTGAAAGFINQGLFFNSADYAYMDGTGTFVRAPVYGTDPGFTNTITASTHVALTSTPSAQNSITLNTLKLSGSGVGFPLNSGQVLTLANGGILKTGGGSPGTISGGNVQSTDSAHDIVVRTDSASDALTNIAVLGFGATKTGTASTGNVLPVADTTGFYTGMSVLVTTNGGAAFTGIGTVTAISVNTSVTLSVTLVSGGSYTATFYGNSLTKSGAGTLTLSASNNLVNVYLDGGQLNLNNAYALGGGIPTTFTGASQNNPIGTFAINEGSTIDNTSGSTLQLAYKYRIWLNGSFTFVGSSDLAFIDPNQNGNIRMTNDVTVTTQTKDKTLKFASNIGVSQGGLTTAKLIKNGPGTLQIGSNGGLGANGGLVINEGVFAGNSAQPDGTYSGLLTLGDATPANSHVAILAFMNGTGHGAPISVRAGSSGTLAMYAQGASPTVYGPTVLSNTLTLGASSGQTFSHYGVISGTGGLTIGNTNAFTVLGTAYTLTNAGTVALFNRNTYTGNTVVKSGTLKLGALGTINNSPLLSLAAGTTLDVSVTSNYNFSASTTLSTSGTTNTAAGWARIIGPSGGRVGLGAQPINLTFTPTSSSGDSVHPALYVSQGILLLNSNTISVVNNGPALGAGVYTLIQAAGGSIGVPSTNLVSVTGNGLAANSYAIASVDINANVILTVVTTDVTAFSNLTPSQTIQQGTANVTLSGTVGDTNGLNPAPFGDTVYVAINGVTNSTTISDGVGGFSITYDTSLIPASGTPYRIKYSYAGNTTTTPPLYGCVDTNTTLTVSLKTVPSITWPSASDITYGQALTNSTLSGGSAVDTNTLAAVPGTFTFTAPLTVPAAAGTYLASGTFTPNDTNSYSTVVLPGAISVPVDQRPTGLASPSVPTRAYDGTTAATITGALTNLLAGDVGQVALAGTGTFGSPAPDVGSGISVVDTSGLSLAGAKAANYLLTAPTGLTGTITQAVLSVTADSLVRPAGVTNPPLTYTVFGYQNGDNAGSVGLTGSPGLSTTADTNSPEGIYTILCSNVDMAITSGDYSLAFVNGQLQVVGLRTWAKGTGAWDIQTSTNWTSASGPATYVDGGAVLFSDAAGGIAPFTVTLSTNVNPYSMTVSNVSKDYSFAGFSINGGGGVLKQGTGALTLGVQNGYSGGTTVSAGTLQYGNQYAFGSGDLTLAGGTTWRKITQEGNSAGLATANSIHLSGGSVTTDISRLSAKDMWLTGVIDGPGGLTLVNDNSGSRVLTLANANSFSGGVRLASGMARVSIQTVNSLGTGTLRCELPPPAGVGNFYIGGLAYGGYDLSAGVTNPVDLAPGANLDIGWASGGKLLLSGPISDGGGLTSWGTGTLSLSGANTYGGATIVNAGTLEVVNVTSLGTGPLVITNTSVAQLDYSGTAPVTSLCLNGVYQAPGVYGSTASGAANPNDTYFTGTGTVTVGPAATATTLTSTPLTGTNGGSVTLTASVVAQSPSMATVNEGTVTFTVTNGAGSTVASVTSSTVSFNAASVSVSLASVPAGVYGVTATYNPAATPPNFTTSTSATAGVLTVKDIPAFSNLATSQSVGYGTASVSLGGTLSAESGTVFPALGNTVTATINGVPHTGTVTDTTGDFTITYPVGTNLPVSGLAYAITYSYAGNGTTLLAATNSSTTLTVTKGTPGFSGLTSHTITAGTPSVTLTGQLNAGSAYPTNGEVVTATINAMPQNGTVTNNSGNFLITFPTGTLTPSGSPYTVTYHYGGNASTLNAAADDTSTTLTVNAVVATSQPTIVSIKVSGGNAILTGTNGTPSGPYALCSSTNVSLPRSTWQTNATSFFDASGNFIITNAMTGAASTFYLIKQ